MVVETLAVDRRHLAGSNHRCTTTITQCTINTTTTTTRHSRRTLTWVVTTTA
jgi:hypothetical protein